MNTHRRGKEKKRIGTNDKLVTPPTTDVTRSRRREVVRLSFSLSPEVARQVAEGRRVTIPSPRLVRGAAARHEPHATVVTTSFPIIGVKFAVSCIIVKWFMFSGRTLCERGWNKPIFSGEVS